MFEALQVPEFSEIHDITGQNLLVVVVLYHRTPDQSSTYRSLLTILPPGSHLFIYDNSPLPSPPRESWVSYLHDSKNSGVSTAYNAAADLAKQMKKPWMLFFDQDTTVTRTLLPGYGRAVRQYQDSTVFVPKIHDTRGLLSPFIFSFGRGWRTKVNAGRLSLSRYKFINSGLLIHHSTFTHAGGYDERISLDFSDISFGDRLEKVLDHFVVIDEALSHGFSDSEKTSVDAAMARFICFRNGAAAMGQRTGKPVLYSFNVFLRACKLSLRYKDLRFFTRYFQQGNG